MNDEKIRKRKKKHFSVAKQNQRNNKNAILKKLNNLNLFLASLGLEFSNNIFHIKEKLDEQVNLNQQVLFYRNNLPIMIDSYRNIQLTKTRDTQTEFETNTINKSTQTENFNNKDYIYRCLKAKDELSISNSKIKILNGLFNNSSGNEIKITQTRLQNLQKKLDSLFGKINRIELSENKMGFYFNIRTKVEYVLKKFIQKYEFETKRVDRNDITILDLNKRYLLLENSTIWIKLAGMFIFV